MRLFGATVLVEMERKAPLQAFVETHGWYPSTYMTPMPVSTPYGVEGYKTMAYDAVLRPREDHLTTSSSPLRQATDYTVLGRATRSCTG